MSDFDKEAEREKLRKKYADDEDDRADTKRMSELLLKGATMTNQHCDTCGDPLFRHNDQTFCPTCQAAAQQPAAQDDSPPQQSTPEQQSPQSQPADTKSTPQQAVDTKSTPQQAADTTQSSPAASTQPAANGQLPTETQPTTERQSTTETQSADATQSTESTPSATPQPSPAAAASGTGLTAARQSLVGTVTRFSQRAAETDDPRRAKELLSAAREAAETLGALELD